MRKWLKEIAYFIQVRLWNTDLGALSDQDKIDLVNSYIDTKIADEARKTAAEKVSIKFRVMKGFAKAFDHPSYLADSNYQDIAKMKVAMDRYIEARKELDTVNEKYRGK